ncbi:hypothetical protein JMUB7507_26590 [Staphylococcus aureus]
MNKIKLKKVGECFLKEKKKQGKIEITKPNLKKKTNKIKQQKRK